MKPNRHQVPQAPAGNPEREATQLWLRIRNKTTTPEDSLLVIKYQEQLAYLDNKENWKNLRRK